MFIFIISFRLKENPQDEFSPWYPNIPTEIRERAGEILAPLLTGFAGAKLLPHTSPDILVIQFERQSAKEMLADAIRLQDLMERHSWEFGQLIPLKTYISTRSGVLTLAFMNPGGNLLDNMVTKLAEYAKAQLKEYQGVV
jgi:hypothetical protein